MKQFFLALYAGSLFFFSCSNSTQTEKGNINAAPDSGVQKSETVAANSPEITLSASPATNQQSDAGLNPAHGEPGHRCDIPVGAPLNSPPGQEPSIQAQPTINTSTPPAPPVKTQPATTAPGMNPPHGEPGHDCSIAVGAPLNK